MTTAELSHLTGKPLGTINRWAREGKIRAEKLPGRTGSRLYRLSDVEHLIEREARGGGGVMKFVDWWW